MILLSKTFVLSSVTFYTKLYVYTWNLCWKVSVESHYVPLGDLHIVFIEVCF